MTELEKVKSELDHIIKLYDDFIKDHTTESEPMLKKDSDDSSNIMSRSTLESSGMTNIQLNTIEDVIQLKELDNKRNELHRKWVELLSKSRN
jgi:hypothetical protein